jgi:hypothetical protein
MDSNRVSCSRILRTAASSEVVYEFLAGERRGVVT